MDQSGFAKEILFVIVIYKKDVGDVLKNTFPSGHDQLTLYVYDNSPDPQRLVGPNVFYLHDGSNPGVSKAYNEACKKALLLKKKWLLLLDQDTRLPPDFLRGYQSAIDQYPDECLFVPFMKDEHGLVSPYRFSSARPARLKTFVKGRHALKHYYFVNSGLLVDTKLFSFAQGYDESFPLDFSDVVFIDRLKSKCNNFVVADLSCGHHLFLTDGTVDLDRMLKRFGSYCRSVRRYARSTDRFIIAEMLTIPMGLKFFLRYHDTKFLKLALKRSWDDV